MKETQLVLSENRVESSLRTAKALAFRALVFAIQEVKPILSRLIDGSRLRAQIHGGTGLVVSATSTQSLLHELPE